MRWHCPTDTELEIRAPAVWGRACYLSVTEASHNMQCLLVCGKETFCFFETLMPERGSSPRSPTFQAGSFNHCTRTPALVWYELTLVFVVMSLFSAGWQLSLLCVFTSQLSGYRRMSGAHQSVSSHLYTILLHKAYIQYLLTCKVSRYCLLALHGSSVPHGRGLVLTQTYITVIRSNRKWRPVFSRHDALTLGQRRRWSASSKPALAECMAFLHI